MSFHRIGTMALVAALSVVPLERVYSETAITPVLVSAPDYARVTLYQNGLGVIDETRTPQIGAQGPTRLTLTGVAPAAIDGSVVIDTSAMDVRRLVYRLQPLSFRLMLERAVGQDVERVRIHPETGAESAQTVRLLGLEGGAAMIAANGRTELVDARSLALSTPDEDLLERPAIDVAGHALAPGSRDLRLRYLVGNVSWKTDYVVDAVGSEAAPELDIAGWASIRNQSGRAFRAQPLMLVAGEVNRTSPQPVPQAEMAQARMMTMAMDAEPMANRVSGGDVHIYSLAGPIDLAAHETTQVRVVEQNRIKAERRYIITGHGHFARSPIAGLQPFQNPDVELRFANTGGEPLPAGNARVYGGERLLGESPIPATPAGEDVTLRIGKAFDLSVRRQQTAFRRLNPPDQGFETAHQFLLRNAKDTATVIEIREQIGGEWELVEASHPMNRDGLNAVWHIEIPAGGEAELTYVVQVKR